MYFTIVFQVIIFVFLNFMFKREAGLQDSYNNFLEFYATKQLLSKYEIIFVSELQF